MKAEKIETGNLNVPQLYEMEKVSEQENVAEKYPEKVFELQTILRQVRNKQDSSNKRIFQKSEITIKCSTVWAGP